MSKLVLPFLETMVTQVCNLSCQGCTNYSDLKHSGYVPWTQGRSWLEPWLDVIDIPDFGIIGGEPLINPELESWLLGVRFLLPHAQIRFTTNGLLLHRWPNLLKLLHSIGNCVFKITAHVEDQLLENNIQNVLAAFDWQPVTEHGISRWTTTNNLRLQINRPQTFLKTYRNNYYDMAPYHSNPEDAFSTCVQKTCPLLYQGRIYKCSTSALLLDTLDRFDRPNWDQWEPYIEKGISMDSTVNEIQQFISNFNKPHAQCAQCPSTSTIPLAHFKTVTRK